MQSLRTVRALRRADNITLTYRHACIHTYILDQNKIRDQLATSVPQQILVVLERVLFKPLR